MPNQRMPQMGVAPHAASIRNSFDLGGSRTYSQPLGMMLPVFHATLNPRESVNLDVISNTQMMTLKGRAFTNFKQRFACFFVKNHDTWSFWDSFITNIPLNNTLKSSRLVYPSSLNGSPTTIANYALPSQSQNYNLLPAAAPNANVFESAYHLLSHYYLSELNSLGAFSTTNDYAARAWVVLYETIYEQNFLSNIHSCSWDDNSPRPTFVNPTDAFGYHIGPSACRLIEFLGYGSVDPDSLVTKLLYDYYLAYMSSETEAIDFAKLHASQFKSINDLGDGDLFTPTIYLDSQSAKAHFFLDLFIQYGFSTGMLTPSYRLKRKRDLFKLIAYQKTYSDYFRNEDFEPYDPFLNNLDYFYDASSLDTDLSIDWSVLVSSNVNKFTNIPSLDQSSYTLIKLLTPRYAHFNQDVITNVKPSPMYTFATPSLPADLLGKFGGMYLGHSIYSNNQGTYTNPSGSVDSNIKGSSTLTQFPAGNVGVGLQGPGLTPQSLRGLFALEKIAKLSASARRSYGEQIRAVYGVAPQYDRHDALFVGSVQGGASVVPVIASSSGSSGETTTDFGQQGGYVDGTCQGRLCGNFVAPDFGELIVITWLECSAPFDATFVDPMVSKIYASDFFHPQFADLGMQPLLTETIDQTKDGCIGFQVRYSEYKQGRDIVFGNFQSGRNKSFMTTHRLPVDNMRIIGHNQFSSVFAENENNPISNYPSTTKWSYVRLFMISPAVTNPICEVAYDGTLDTDPVDVHSNFQCVVNRDMSDNGEPIV